jgi:hypothetical protein
MGCSVTENPEELENCTITGELMFKPAVVMVSGSSAVGVAFDIAETLNAAFTVSDVEPFPVPPAPVHASWYVSVPAALGVTGWVPLVASEPVQAPLAVQEDALVEDQVSVALVPAVTVEGLIDIETEGVGVVVTGVDPVPPQPVIIRLMITRERPLAILAKSRIRAIE